MANDNKNEISNIVCMTRFWNNLYHERSVNINNSELSCTCLEGYSGDTCEGLYILFYEYLKSLNTAISKNKM